MIQLDVLLIELVKLRAQRRFLFGRAAPHVDGDADDGCKRKMAHTRVGMNLVVLAIPKAKVRQTLGSERDV